MRAVPRYLGIVFRAFKDDTCAAVVGAMAGTCPSLVLQHQLLECGIPFWSCRLQVVRVRPQCSSRQALPYKSEVVVLVIGSGGHLASCGALRACRAYIVEQVSADSSPVLFATD